MTMKVSGIKDIDKELGKDLATLVQVQRATDCYYIKCKGFIRPREKWVQINTVIKELGGKWISMDRDSHWEIPFGDAPKLETGQDALRHEAMKMMREAEAYIETLKVFITNVDKLTKKV